MRVKNFGGYLVSLMRVTTVAVVVWCEARGGGASLGGCFFGFFFSRLRASLLPMKEE